ncbi:uncharacterized protein TNCV_1853871 [Trichonephila clavipes]|nr:uncharacterized protein TNCV_1853871 [Trichonephila clavipes]
MTDKDILQFVQSSKNILDADSEDENERNNSAPVPTSSEMRNIMKTTRGLLATDHVILNHGQVMWTTPELAPPLLTTTPHQREDVSALDRFNVHRCPTRRVFSGTGLEPVTKQATVRYLYHSATAVTPQPPVRGSNGAGPPKEH